MIGVAYLSVFNSIVALLAVWLTESYRKRQIDKWKAVYLREGMSDEGAHLSTFYKVWRGIDYGRD